MYVQLVYIWHVSNRLKRHPEAPRTALPISNCNLFIFNTLNAAILNDWISSGPKKRDKTRKPQTVTPSARAHVTRLIAA